MKHAYLITSHNNFEVLKYTLRLIDDDRNTVFLLIDKKCKKETQFLRNIMIKSDLIILPRQNIYWAGYSQINATLNLIRNATNHKDKFSYYHFLQGVDLPIKNQDIIHRFFEVNNGKEFIGFNPSQYEFAKYKAKYYHFFVENKYFRNGKFIKIANHSLAHMQKILKIERNTNIRYYHGSALFSITDEFARYVLSREKVISKLFKYTLACDEVFLQTIVMDSIFKDRLYKFEIPSKGNLRYIDWSRQSQKNSPWVFTINELDKLTNAPDDLLFARKFNDQNIRVVEEIYNFITKKDKSL